MTNDPSVQHVQIVALNAKVKELETVNTMNELVIQQLTHERDEWRRIALEFAESVAVLAPGLGKKGV